MKTTYLQNLLVCWLMPSDNNVFVHSCPTWLAEWFQLICGLHSFLLMKWPCWFHFHFTSAILHDWELFSGSLARERSGLHVHEVVPKTHGPRAACLAWGTMTSVQNNVLMVNTPGSWGSWATNEVWKTINGLQCNFVSDTWSPMTWLLNELLQNWQNCNFWRSS